MTHLLYMLFRIRTRKKPVETIDAVHQVVVGLLKEQRKQPNMTTPTPIIRRSRLDNTTGVNITEEKFLKMMKGKTSINNNIKPTQK